MEVITEWLGVSKAGRILEIILTVLALLFLLVFTYEGWLLAVKATDRSPVLELPNTLWYLSLPISGVIMLGYTIRDFWAIFKRRA